MIGLIVSQQQLADKMHPEEARHLHPGAGPMTLLRTKLTLKLATITLT
jgi:hypothetical protein